MNSISDHTLPICLLFLVISLTSYFLLFKKSIKMGVDSVRIYNGLRVVSEINLNEIYSVQLFKVITRQKFSTYINMVCRITINQSEIEIGGENDFNSLKSALEAKCRLRKSETAKEVYEKLKIDDSSSSFQEELVCEYICEWSQ